MTFAQISLRVSLSMVALLAACSSAPTDPINSGGSSSSATSSIASSAVSSVASLPAGSFSNGSTGYSGDVYLRGYARTETVSEAFCQENCTTLEYVFFHITETSNPSINSFLADFAGNSFVRDNAIGLGCVEAGVISYEHDGEGASMQKTALSAGLTSDILASSSRTPITLHLSKLPPAPGMGAPSCYSHFNSVERY